MSIKREETLEKVYHIANSIVLFPSTCFLESWFETQLNSCYYTWAGNQSSFFFKAASRFMGQYNGKWSNNLAYVSKLLITVITAINALILIPVETGKHVHQVVDDFRAYSIVRWNSSKHDWIDPFSAKQNYSNLNFIAQSYKQGVSNIFFWISLIIA